MNSLRYPRDSSISSASILLTQVTSWNCTSPLLPPALPGRFQSPGSYQHLCQEPLPHPYIWVPSTFCSSIRTPLRRPSLYLRPQLPSVPALTAQGCHAYAAARGWKGPESPLAPLPAWPHDWSMSKVTQHQHGQPQTPSQLSPGFLVQGTRTLGFWTTLLT